ncbi:hypothetical protein BGZ52_010887 [Haplosporangium bisporale]|nr:hypothetical protein BGZ52_010887 [Haplosporangium bisporale]KAF9212402.1 hypothetical protein BGZ59_006809 [Podila verticillata]KAI9237383.1 MAG: hypothetical protein BYD32DRAFT_436642 [Podila humilis]KFH67114.1 hypothetical protein MVEG_07637 [Podila verticillata NRRL 6337]
MVKSVIAFVAAIAMASSVSAQTLFYSQPIAATQWTAGKPATVSWTNTCSDVVGNTTFPISLNQQSGLYQVEVPGVNPIGYLNCAKAGSTTVNIPATIPQGNTYSILVVDGGNQSYSAMFTILSTVPGVNTTTALPTPTSTTATSTAATTSLTTVTTTTGPATPTSTSHAGALKAGSTAALVVLAAVASMML